METALFHDLAFVLAAALIGGVASFFLRLPLLTGYIVAGVVLAGLSPLLGVGSQISQLAQLGILLLLFTLGIELSFGKLSRVFQIAVFGGLIQILVTIFLGLLILPSFGISGNAALVLAFCFSLSSTAVVVKLLLERGEADTLPGEILTGWLLVQDLAVIPMVTLLPVLNGAQNGVGVWSAPLALLKAGILVAGAIVAGKLIIPRFMNWVAKSNSREFFLLGVMTLIFAVAFLASFVGISPALGAFLAGLVIAETSQNHAVFAEVRPLREIFMILFFVSLGALVAPSFILANWLAILILAGLFLLIKFAVSFVLVLLSGYHGKTAFWVGIGLANIGEFSFLIAALAGSLGILTSLQVQMAVSVTLVSLICTSILFMLRHPLWQTVKPMMVGVDHRGSLPQNSEMSNHLILCGFGRMGSWLGRAAELAKIPFVVVEYNQNITRELAGQGVNVVYGDPADREVLEAAQVQRAKLVAVALPDQHTQELIVAHVKNANPKAKIISRVHNDQDLAKLSQLGVNEIIQPEFEGALSMVRKILEIFGHRDKEVAAKLKTIRLEHAKKFKS